MPIRNKVKNAYFYIVLMALGLYISAYQNALTDIINTIDTESGGGFLSGIGLKFDGRASYGGFIVALHFAAALFFPVIFGVISDFIGRKPVFICCFSLIIIGLALIIMTERLLFIGAGVFIIGGGYCTLESGMSSLLGEANPGNEIGVINLSQMFFCIGAVAGPLLGAVTNNFKYTYVLILAVFLIFFDILVFMKINDAQQTGRIRLSTFGKLTGRYFIIIAVAMFVYMGIEEGAAFWTGEYITAFGGSAFSGNTFGAEISPYFLSVYWFGMAVSRFAASFIKKRVILFCIVSVTVGLAAFLLLLNINNAFIMLTCFAAIGFGIAPVWPLCMALAVKSSPLTPNAAAGVVSAVGSGGAAAIPFALGIAADKFGIKSAFGFIAALVAAMLGLLFLLSRSDLIKNKAKSEGEK